MKREQDITFDPFHLDLGNECLWRGERALALTPKAFAVLRSLVERAGYLVSKEELLSTVWSETVVSDAVLKVCVGEIRKILGDDSKAPRFIETAHRRGYRFIAPITTAAQPVSSSKFQVSSSQSAFRIPQSHWWVGRRSCDSCTGG
jgi:DNA-binding winged helix-turn-helix (wHTH) protein